MMKSNARIAIITTNTLAGLGMRSVLTEMMPHIDAVVLNHLPAPDEEYVHYFVSSDILMANAAYFLERQHHCIVLVHGDEGNLLPQGFHTMNVCQPLETMRHAFKHLAHQGHTNKQPTNLEESTLTAREIEVLKLIVRGRINKEVAEELGISLTTVISHRKNLSEKLQAKSLSALTIYAVSHGLLRPEEL